MKRVKHLYDLVDIVDVKMLENNLNNKGIKIN
jgi:hypothetical protein